MYEILSTNYSFEMELEMTETKGRVWVVFVYASVKEKLREDRWHNLYVWSIQWGDK